MKAKGYGKFFLSLGLGVLLTPLILYGWIFGLVISSDHARWAEFGSAMGGIYSPMIAALALFVLLRQVNLQQQLAKYEFDQGYLQQARQDLEFYCSQLAVALNGDTLPGKSLRGLLQENFRFLSVSELKKEEIKSYAESIHQAAPEAFDLWTAIYPILRGLNTSRDSMYELTFESSRQKLIALLSFQTCVTLENYCRAIYPPDVTFEFFFNES